MFNQMCRHPPIQSSWYKINYPRGPFPLWFSSPIMMMIVRFGLPRSVQLWQCLVWTLPRFNCGSFFHSQKHPSLNNTLYDNSTHNAFSQPLWNFHCLHYIVLTCGYVSAPLLDYDLRAESVLTHLFGYHRASNGIGDQNIFSKLMKIQSAKSCQCPNYSH